MRKPATMLEKRFMAQIKHLNCIICGDWPVDCHHITQAGRRLGNCFCLPLCVNCHRGANGFSGSNRKAWDKTLPNQLRLLKKVCDKLEMPTPEYKSKVVRREAQ